MLNRSRQPGDLCLVRGQVLDGDGRPIRGAELDVWGTNRNGFCAVLYSKS